MLWQYFNNKDSILSVCSQQQEVVPTLQVHFLKLFNFTILGDMFRILQFIIWSLTCHKNYRVIQKSCANTHALSGARDLCACHVTMILITTFLEQDEPWKMSCLGVRKCSENDVVT
jgi:hypothetical protein